MKRSAILIGLIFLLALAAGCAQDAGEQALLPPEADVTLNTALTGLLGASNETLRESVGGACYAEILPRGNARLTYFSPFCSFRFALKTDGVWQAQEAAGMQEENPFLDSLRVDKIELCEMIDTEAPFVGEQPSLRQLFQTGEPITYELLCAAFRQKPALTHIDEVYYDTAFVSGDPEAFDVAGEEGFPRVGDSLPGGEERAEFTVDSLRLTVGFLSTEDGLYAFHAIVEER